jgi:hypothetical protein
MTLKNSAQPAPNHHYESTTLGWSPACDCYGLPIIGEQPKKPSKGNDGQYEYNIRLARWKAEMSAWRVRWEQLKPQYDALPVVSCKAGDIFAGAATTLLVADRLGRDAVGIELNPDYVDMSADRIRGDAPMFVDLEVVR